MNRRSKKIYSGFAIMLLLVIGLFSSCQKDYYEDSGLQNGIYTISTLDFLTKDTFFFDSVVTIIHLADIDHIMADSTITFFSPTDHAIARAMDQLNSERYENFEDSLTLADIPGEVWRKFLFRYIFRGKYMLKDIARRDPIQLDVYPGMNMESWNGYIMNLGVLFSDYEGTKDVGPRTLTLTDIGNLANPKMRTSNVATSDLQTKNGVIHVLDDNHEFGFSASDFVNIVKQYIY